MLHRPGDLLDFRLSMLRIIGQCTRFLYLLHQPRWPITCKPVKSFITFVILSQISCGKVQNPPYIFLHKTMSKFLLVCCSFQDYLVQMKKKPKILRDWVHTSVVQGNMENCSEPRRNFYTVLCRKL